MKFLVVTPLLVELDQLIHSLKARSFTEETITVGRLSVHLFPALDLGLALGGHGKVQCAVQTQHLLDCLDSVELVICAGAAGALSDQLSIGDLVIATTTIEHDYRLKFATRLSPQFPGAPEALSSLQQSELPPSTWKIHYGMIASGDEDVVDAQRGQELHMQTGAIAVAWEGAGVGRACNFCNTRFIEVRGITDSANHDAPADFAANVSVAMHHVAELLSNWLVQKAAVEAPSLIVQPQGTLSCRNFGQRVKD